MAQIPDTCTFDVTADKLNFTTRTNGDTIVISQVDLNYNQAASLAWLVNQTAETLEIRVRIKP